MFKKRKFIENLKVKSKSVLLSRDRIVFMAGPGPQSYAALDLPSSHINYQCFKSDTVELAVKIAPTLC
jgi:hypothetical protein